MTTVSISSGYHVIAKMNADGTGFIQVSRLSYPASYPSWSANGEKILFYGVEGGHPGVYMMDPDGRNVIRITPALVDDYSPKWGPGKAGISISADNIVIPRP